MDGVYLVKRIGIVVRVTQVLCWEQMPGLNPVVESPLTS
jgi:hypothetical protein